MPCSKELPAADLTTQVETALDHCLKHQRLMELGHIVDDIRKLRESASDVDEAIDELEMKLLTIRKLILDVCIHIVSNITFSVLLLTPVYDTHSYYAIQVFRIA